MEADCKIFSTFVNPCSREKFDLFHVVVASSGDLEMLHPGSWAMLTHCEIGLLCGRTGHQHSDSADKLAHGYHLWEPID